MTRGLHGAKREITRLSSSEHVPNICISCRQNFRRQYATTASRTTAAANPEQIPLAQHNPPVVTSTAPHQAFAIRAGVVLSRAPLLTRDLTPFEKAFYLYQRRLNERTAMPFSRYFYFQKNTPGDVDWKRKIKLRKTAARDIGVYSAWGKGAEEDELRVGATESEPDVQMEALLQDAVVEETDDGTEGTGKQASKDEAAVERPLPRVTDADKNNDLRSLNRALSRTLYFVVKGQDGGWRFPSDVLVRPESLHRAAERLLVQSAGPNMNTWIVGNAPIGHHVERFEQAIKDAETRNEVLGQKTFFMKSRIFAGKPDLKGNRLGLQDYKWLAKEELEAEVEPQYWKSIKNMLVAL